jgi:DnaJ-class molecular chaperone
MDAVMGEQNSLSCRCEKSSHKRERLDSESWPHFAAYANPQSSSFIKVSTGSPNGLPISASANSQERGEMKTVKAWAIELCPSCKGSGKRYFNLSYKETKTAYGQAGSSPCKTCNGTGQLTRSKRNPNDQMKSIQAREG